MIYFHKYFTKKKYFKNITEFYLTLASIVFIACKTTNEFIHLNDLIEFLCSFLNLPNDIYYNEQILSIEFSVLNALGFDTNYDLPYKYLLSMRQYFYDQPFGKKLFEVCCYYINDSFKLPTCIYYHPLLIALASVHLAQKTFNRAKKHER